MSDELTDHELQSLRNMGNEAERAADEITHLRAALAAAQPPVAQADPIVEAWLLGHALQYLVLGGHDDEWTDFSGGGKPNTGSKRLAWRLKPTAQPPAAMPVPRNQGHGHVTQRPDGLKARCGGPVMCRVCQQEQANSMLAAAPTPQAQSVPATGAQPDMRAELEAYSWRTRGRPLRLSDPEMAPAMARLKERIATDPAFALGLMASAGICNEDGTLAEQYGGAPTAPTGSAG